MQLLISPVWTQGRTLLRPTQQILTSLLTPHSPKRSTSADSPAERSEKSSIQVTDDTFTATEERTESQLFLLQNFWIASPMIAWRNTKYQSACLIIMPHFRAASRPNWWVTFRNWHRNYRHSSSNDWTSRNTKCMSARILEDQWCAVMYMLNKCWGSAIERYFSVVYVLRSVADRLKTQSL